MNILVINCGSSSLNYKLYAGAEKILCAGKAHRVGVRGSEPSFIEHTFHGETARFTTSIPDHAAAASLALDFLLEKGLKVEAVGHRFVHGGNIFQQTVLLTPHNQAQLEECLPLAPIHNPNSKRAIRVCQERLPGIPEYLTFDTAFHAPLPPEATTYALPAELARKYGLRKYGFHGLSYQYVTRAAADFLGRPLEDLRMVACHLGTGGSSVTAVLGGKSVETSMGYSPLAGLMMSTRTGDLDPMIPLALMREEGLDPAALNALFNKKSGLVGISGFSADIRDSIQAMDQKNDPRARLAFEMYTSRLKKAIGSYAALLGGMDVLLFTDDIGAQNPRVRSAACAGLEWCGVLLDQEANQQADPHRMNRINAPDSPVVVLCTPTDEEGVIVREGVRLLTNEMKTGGLL